MGGSASGNRGGDLAQAGDRAGGQRDAGAVGEGGGGAVELDRIRADGERVGQRQRAGGVDLERARRAGERGRSSGAGRVEQQSVGGARADGERKSSRVFVRARHLARGAAFCPYTTLFRSNRGGDLAQAGDRAGGQRDAGAVGEGGGSAVEL